MARGRIKPSRSYALIATIVAIVVIVVFLYVFPWGYRVEAKVRIEVDNPEIIDCRLAKFYLLEMLPEENATRGDKTLVLTVMVNENEILRAERQNLGEGVAIIRTGSIPGNIKTGTRLVVTVSLYRGAELLSQASKELIR